MNPLTQADSTGFKWWLFMPSRQLCLVSAVGLALLQSCVWTGRAMVRRGDTWGPVGKELIATPSPPPQSGPTLLFLHFLGLRVFCQPPQLPDGSEGTLVTLSGDQVGSGRPTT